MPEVTCAWCGVPIGESPVEHSHGICPACYRQLRGVPDLSEPELDAPKTFRFTFRFPTGPVRVQILFLRKGAGASVAVRKL
jgi:hypothetical protein